MPIFGILFDLFFFYSRGHGGPKDVQIFVGPGRHVFVKNHEVYPSTGSISKFMVFNEQLQESLI